MNIPFDEIYNFLNRITHDDTIIYRFFPHGSKKLLDLGELCDSGRDWTDWNDSRFMIMHDQEPLDFDAHAPDHIISVLPQWLHRHVPALGWYGENQRFISEIAQYNLAALCFLVTSDVNLICHSEKNSQHVRRYRNIGLEPVYYWSHAMIARDWYRYAWHDPALQYHEPYQRDFLIYNRAWSGSREYRLKFADLVIESGLVSTSHMGFAPTDQGGSYLDHRFHNHDFKPTNDLTVLPLNTSTPDHSATYDWRDYQRCWWEVVLETLFDDPRHHLTEKILRPIACGKPFILAATPGSLGYLREYGFKTFDGIIDEGYDSIVDPLSRLHAIIKTMKSIQSWDQQQRSYYHGRLQEICAHNKELFFSDRFYQHVLGEFKHNYDVAVTVSRQHHRGQRWKMARRWLSSHHQHRLRLVSDNERRTRDDIKNLLLRCHHRGDQ
jgi:hypothetical protein